MKKVWIASIFACIIMLMVPITNVVGNSDIDEDSVRASPLFNLRSKRAVDEESKDLTYDYIGKGKPTLITIPKRDIESTVVQKVIDKMNKMDDKTSNRFVDLIIRHLYKRDNLQEYSKERIALFLNQLMNSPNEITPYILGEKTNLHTDDPTIILCGVTTDSLLACILAYIMLILVFIGCLMAEITVWLNCYPPTNHRHYS